ncbi:hypothetical protein PG997_013767 [Apiospora hydei]|uniref:Uncharacterized protein n=1 Tax=Apiospora hydei TaxID=1337664 RepID=A0ABR1V770_9PEZI
MEKLEPATLDGPLFIGQAKQVKRCLAVKQRVNVEAFEESQDLRKDSRDEGGPSAAEVTTRLLAEDAKPSKSSRSVNAGGAIAAQIVGIPLPTVV